VIARGEGRVNIDTNCGDLNVVTRYDFFFLHLLATVEFTCVISAIFKIFVVVISRLERGTLVTADSKPHLTCF
jgi:hypothetical protein